MPIETVITLYSYEELSDRAKERAKEWWLSCRDETDYECVIEDFVEVAKLLGITMKTHPVQLMSGKTRYDPSVWYSVAYCQGDFAAFDGYYDYVRGSAKAVKDYAPQDETLHGIADQLQALQAANFYQLRATVTHHHYYGLQAEVTRESGNGDSLETSYETDKALLGIMRDLCQWLYRQLVKQDEWLSSEEQIAEAMAANEYTFREDGRREG